MNLPLKFVAIALSDLNADFGGIGFEFYRLSSGRTSRSCARGRSVAGGGSGWDARKKKPEFLQRVSITIAKGK